MPCLHGIIQSSSSSPPTPPESIYRLRNHSKQFSSRPSSRPLAMRIQFMAFAVASARAAITTDGVQAIPNLVESSSLRTTVETRHESGVGGKTVRLLTSMARTVASTAYEFFRRYRKKARSRPAMTMRFSILRMDVGHLGRGHFGDATEVRSE
uniref:Uncharacterized protein n=1 Tax=Peronospora matthiolae TaxID=2874970 RepID=A0AAV1V268_9STRA